MKRMMRSGAMGAAAMLCAHFATAQLGVPLYGDVNLDGVVDDDDIDIVTNNLNLEYMDICTTGDRVSVLDGDANFDGFVTMTDLNWVLTNYTESLPAIAAVAGVDISSSYNPTTKTITATDYYGTMSGVTLLDGSGSMPVWRELPSHLIDSSLGTLEPSITLVQKDDGFDLFLEYDNTLGSAAKQLGQIFVPNIEFTNPVHVRSFLTDSKEYTYEPSGTNNYTPTTHPYPDGKYAPIEVARGEIDAAGSPEYIVGAALIYPVLEYKHGVRMFTQRSGQQWHVRIDMNPKFWGSSSSPQDNGDYSLEGNIQPGETRSYRITVRFMRPSTWSSIYPLTEHDNDWLRLLLDYRRYFRQSYGLVQYTRDERPMLAINVAGGPANACDLDPYGFNNTASHPDGTSTNLRPNIYGWTGWVDYMETRETHGYQRFMLRKPSGIFCPSGLNFPFQFTSNWWEIADNDPYEPILDTLEEIEDFVKYDSDRQVALWWGRAVQVMTTWPAYTATPLDLCNSTLVGLAEDEMDGAMVVAASAIGLDAVTQMPAWERHDWLRYLREHYPGVLFIGEPRSSDFTHTLGGSWIQAMHDNATNVLWVREPNALMDMLVPGHETHAAVRSVTGYTTQTELQAAAQDFASWGYVPHIFNGSGDISSNPTPYNAVQSWLSTVPSDILASE